VLKSLGLLATLARWKVCSLDISSLFFVK